MSIHLAVVAGSNGKWVVRLLRPSVRRTRRTRSGTCGIHGSRLRGLRL